MVRIAALFVVAALAAAPLAAQDSEAPEAPAAPEAEPPMTLDRLGEIVSTLDPEAQSNGVAFQMTINDVPVLIVTDASADRMRAMTPIRSADAVPPEELIRLMQANFDTALDARYAVAQGRLWSVFIHPLSPLEKNQFISGLGQVVNLALTYGSLYTGGAMTFGGGDSDALHRALIDELLKKGEPI
ncbi:MAG: hypothetical protein AAGF90_14335 [Pseudomonadota bacterium]